MAKTEGNTYDATWKRSGKSFIAWLKRRPKQMVTGRTEEELVEQLWEIAMDEFGDGEACINLEPPLPVSTAATRYFDPPWFSLSHNEGFHMQGDSAPLYSRGLCPFCHAGLGGRNDSVRLISGELKGHLGLVWWALPSVTLVSEAFLKYICEKLENDVRAFPCSSARRARKQMWELELDGRVSLVYHKSSTHNEGVYCPKCGTARFGGFVHPPIQKGYIHALSRDALPELSSGMSVAMAGESRELIVDQATANEIKAKGFKGVMFNRLAFLPAKEIGEFKIRKLKKSEV